MATNFPTSLDTTLELGATFSNTAAVTDPVTQIDAQYRVNVKDALLAIEARIGITNSTVPTSLSWATLSDSGVDNQGLRFSQGNAQWPGLVAEDGIFLDSATGFVAFHRSGDAVGTFYPLTSSGLVVSLQAAYNTSGAITTSGADDIAFTIAAGDDFTVTHAAGSRTVLSSVGTTLTTGVLDINCTNIAANNVSAVNTQTTNLTNNQQFGSYLADTRNVGDLIATQIVYGYAADLIMSGDGPGAGRAFGAGFYAKSSFFSGANNYESAGLYVDSSFDWGVFSESTLQIEMPASAVALQINSDPSAFTAATTIAAIGTDSRSGFISCIEGTLDTPVAVRYFMRTDGAATYTVDSTADALTVSQASTGAFLTCTDPGVPATRFQIEDEGNTQIFVAASYAGPALLIDHGAATEPFIDFSGTYNATAANGNVTDEDTGGAVVGPGTNTWTWRGMARVEVSNGGGGIPAGDYWVALYD